MKTGSPLVLFCALLVTLTSPATALDSLWSTDLGSPARSHPIPVDVDRDGASEILLTTRFDGTLWLISGSGEVLCEEQAGQWLEGNPAPIPAYKNQPPCAIYQESTGALNILDLKAKTVKRLEVEGSPCLGTGPCAADLDGNGTLDYIAISRAGIVCALDPSLTPLWQYDAGSTLDSTPVVLPVQDGPALVLLETTDGALHAVDGHGLPLWRFKMHGEGPVFPDQADPVVLPRPDGTALVLASDSNGSLYAIDPASGQERWRAQTGTSWLGTPAIAEVAPEEGLETITVSQTGELAIVSASGIILSERTLPESRYVPRPLVADIDADGCPELIVPANAWKILVTDLRGEPKEEIELRGRATEGLTLADVTGDGFLELLAATDCAQMVCYATKAPPAEPTLPEIRFANKTAVPEAGPAKEVMALSAAASVPSPKHPSFGHLSVAFPPECTGNQAVLIARAEGRIVGSARKSINNHPVTIPFVRYPQAPLSLDIQLAAAEGTIVAVTKGLPVPFAQPDEAHADSLQDFEAAVQKRARAFEISDAWEIPTVLGRDCWNIVSFMPETWEKYGLSERPFIKEAIRRIHGAAANPKSLFKPGHPAWDAMATNPDLPFFVMNEYFRPTVRYPDDAHQAILDMAGDRFLGYPVHEWGYHAWKNLMEDSPDPPATREEATRRLEEDFRFVMGQIHNRIYEGQGYCLFHHHAFKWGAPMGYVEVGENIPCAPLQYAFIRGASRQYGGRPWGAYVSNWFRASVLDSRFFPDQPRVRWEGGENSTGPDCGHSPSLEYRLEMAGYLAGAVFIHHESDAHHGSVFMEETAPEEYRISPFGEALEACHAYANKWPERGIPFTPIALMVDFDHGWRPRENVYGLWPQDRSARALEAFFKQAYPYGGRLDFERGYLADGPYGDIFDALTNEACLETLGTYGVVWSVGEVSFTDQQRQDLMAYVHNGGILVLDAATASGFPALFLGARLTEAPALASQCIMQASALLPSGAPFSFHALEPAGDCQVIAHTGSGAPLLTWRSHGKGILILSGTTLWTDETSTLLPLAHELLKRLARAFRPIDVSGDIELLLNRTPHGWIVGLINNHGVTKVPIQPAVVDPEQYRDCVIRFHKDLPARFEPRLGSFRWSETGTELLTRIPPGEVAIVELVEEKRFMKREGERP